MPKLFQRQKREWENFYLNEEIRTLKEKESDWECLVYIYRGNVPKREGFLFLFGFGFYFDTYFFKPKCFLFFIIYLILILMLVFLILQSAHISTLIYCPQWLQAFTIILFLIFFLVLVYLFHGSSYFFLFLSYHISFYFIF